MGKTQEIEEEVGRRSSIAAGFGEGTKTRWRQVVTEDFSLELESFRNKKVLEIGGGAYGILPILDNARLRVGLEPLAGKFIDVYRTYDPEGNVVHVSGIGENLPFDNGCFDIVILYNVLQHTLSPQKVIEESYRVLGGELLVREADFGILGKLLKTPLKWIDRQHAFHFHKREIENFAYQVGFDIFYSRMIQKSDLKSIIWRFKTRRWKRGIMLIFSVILGIRDCHYILRK